MNKMEHHNLGNEHQNGTFTPNCNFHPNLLKTSFVHKVSKNKAYTWNEHLFKYPKWKLASEIDHFVVLPKLPKTFFSFKMSKIKIRKMSKIKIHIWEKHPWILVNGCFCFLNPVWSKGKFCKACRVWEVHLMKIKLPSYIIRKF